MEILRSVLAGMTLMAGQAETERQIVPAEVSRVEVKQGEKLRLRFGLLLHAAAPDKDKDLAAAYRDFLGQRRPAMGRVQVAVVLVLCVIHDGEVLWVQGRRSD